MPIVHYCFSQHLNESMPPRRCTGICSKTKRSCACKKCKCREEASMARAKQLVDSGAAEWVIVRKETIQTKQVCPLCCNDNLLKRSCSNCNKTGEIVIVEFALIRGNDIIMVTSGSGESGQEVFRSVMAKQTPRVATIEYAHMQRAYINGYKEEQERINIYGEMNKELLDSLIVPFKPDPWEGRAVFTFGADERSVSSDWNRER